MILVIDNYDSFVHNLARHMELAGWETHVVRNDKIVLTAVMAMKPEAIVISPGPRTPKEAGICLDLIRNFSDIPILGICLGHQCIGEAYGLRVEQAGTPMHGRASMVTHNDDELFDGVPETFKAGRYHSLAIHNNGASPLQILARTKEGEIMAVKHESFPVYGLQFHPESVLTPYGMQIIKNFSRLALAWNTRKLAA